MDGNPNSICFLSFHSALWFLFGVNMVISQEYGEGWPGHNPSYGIQPGFGESYPHEPMAGPWSEQYSNDFQASFPHNVRENLPVENEHPLNLIGSNLLRGIQSGDLFGSPVQRRLGMNPLNRILFSFLGPRLMQFQLDMMMQTVVSEIIRKMIGPVISVVTDRLIHPHANDQGNSKGTINFGVSNQPNNQVNQVSSSNGAQISVVPSQNGNGPIQLIIKSGGESTANGPFTSVALGPSSNGIGTISVGNPQNFALPVPHIGDAQLQQTLNQQVHQLLLSKLPAQLVPAVHQQLQMQLQEQIPLLQQQIQAKMRLQLQQLQQQFQEPMNQNSMANLQLATQPSSNPNHDGQQIFTQHAGMLNPVDPATLPLLLLQASAAVNSMGTQTKDPNSGLSSQMQINRYPLDLQRSLLNQVIRAPEVKFATVLSSAGSVGTNDPSNQEVNSYLNNRGLEANSQRPFGYVNSTAGDFSPTNFSLSQKKEFGMPFAEIENENHNNGQTVEINYSDGAQTEQSFTAPSYNNGSSFVSEFSSNNSASIQEAINYEHGKHQNGQSDDINSFNEDRLDKNDGKRTQLSSLESEINSEREKNQNLGSHKYGDKLARDTGKNPPHQFNIDHNLSIRNQAKTGHNYPNQETESQSSNNPFTYDDQKQINDQEQSSSERKMSFGEKYRVESSQLSSAVNAESYKNFHGAIEEADDSFKFTEEQEKERTQRWNAVLKNLDRFYGNRK